MSRQWCHLLGLFLFLGLAVGCPDAPERQPTEVEEEEEEEENNNNNNNNNNNHNNHSDVDAGPVYTGSIAGRIVNRAGESLVGLKILACSSSLCMTADTDANGEYLVTDMNIEPRHVQVTDLSNTYMGVLFYQDVIPNEINILSRYVVLPNLSGEASSLPEASGGTVTLADGALELTVPANALEYPFGYDDEIIQAERLDGEEIPPYDIEPWMSRKADSFAFAFFPQNTKSTENVSFKVKMGVEQPEGTKYFIWTADFSHASLHNVGTATVDATGHLVSDTGAEVKDLTTIVLIPDIPVPGEGTDAGVVATDGGNETVAAADAGTSNSATGGVDAGN